MSVEISNRDRSSIVDFFPEPDCTKCVHFHRDDADITCNAFMEGIPQEIWLSKRKHISSYPGDHNLRFWLREEE